MQNDSLQLAGRILQSAVLNHLIALPLRLAGAPFARWHCEDWAVLLAFLATVRFSPEGCGLLPDRLPQFRSLEAGEWPCYTPCLLIELQIGLEFAFDEEVYND
jgi:hypothetical protein